MTHQFTPQDKTGVWFKQLKDSLNQRLSDLRKLNDKDHSPEETAKLRGRIQEIKELLSDMGDKPNPTIAPRRNPYN